MKRFILGGKYKDRIAKLKESAIVRDMYTKIKEIKMNSNIVTEETGMEEKKEELCE
jgi:hypothetical protein